MDNDLKKFSALNTIIGLLCIIPALVQFMGLLTLVVPVLIFISGVNISIYNRTKKGSLKFSNYLSIGMMLDFGVFLLLYFHSDYNYFYPEYSSEINFYLSQIFSRAPSSILIHRVVWFVTRDFPEVVFQVALFAVHGALFYYWFSLFRKTKSLMEEQEKKL